MNVRTLTTAWLAAGLLASACTNQLPTFIEQDEILAVEVPNSCSVLNVGQTCTLSARALTERGERVPGARLLWESREPNVAAVVGDRDEGVVTANAPGSTTVVARVPGTQIEGQTLVRVVEDPSEMPGAAITNLQFDVVADRTDGALSGSMLATSLREGAVTIGPIEFEAFFRRPDDPGFTGVEVSACAFAPEAPPITVRQRVQIEFDDCDLSLPVPSGATFSLTVFVEVPGSDRRVEVVAEGVVP